MTYKALKKRFEEQVAALQQKCEHESVSDWAVEQWAPGHTTGREVRRCLNCNKAFYRGEKWWEDNDGK